MEEDRAPWVAHLPLLAVHVGPHGAAHRLGEADDRTPVPSPGATRGTEKPQAVFFGSPPPGQLQTIFGEVAAPVRYQVQTHADDAAKAPMSKPLKPADDSG